MPINITKHEEKNWIEMKLTGDFTLETAAQGVEFAIQTLLETNYQHILVDTRSTNVTMGILDFYRLAGLIAKKVKSAGLKLGAFKRAHLGKNGWKELQFFETVLYNRGQVMKLFSDREKAIEWLLEGE